mgnify:FL=1
MVVDGQITNINVIEPGTGYLSVPDGSTGGDGKVWAKPDETTVVRADGEVEIPYPPGNVITVIPDDVVLMPPGTAAVTEPLGSADVQQIIAEQGDVLGDDVASQVGGGERIPGGKSHVMEKSGKFTTPSDRKSVV